MVSRICPVKFSLLALVAMPFLARADESPAHTDDAPAPVVAEVQPETYLVVPLQNESPMKNLDWMSSAIAVTVAEKLESHPRLRAVYGPQVIDGFEKAFDAEKIARRAHDLGAHFVVSGAFARPNWKSELKLRLYSVTEAPADAVDKSPTLHLVEEVESVAEQKQLLDQIDQNLLSLLGKVGWTPPDAESLALIMRRPTKDLYAFTVYGRALNLLFGLGGPRVIEESIRQFRKANLIDPKFAESHRMLGVAYLEDNDHVRASSQYAYALDLKPDYFAALSGLARLYRAEANRSRALEMLDKALTMRPWDIDTREMLGELLWENGELDRALEELKKVLELQPNNLAARRTLALVYAARGETTDLAAELERIQELAPDDLDVRLDLGSAYQRMGATDKAVATYEDVLKAHPKNVQALKFLGDCYRRRGELDRAITAYQRVMKLQPDDPRPYFLLGAVYLESGNENKAEQVFQDAQQFHRYIGEAWDNLGAIAFRHGDLSRAFWYLSRSVLRAPARPKGHYNFALVLSAKKDRERALDELKIASELDPADPEVHYLWGVILLRQGRLDEAKFHFIEALKRRPEHADAKHNLALLEDLERRYGSEHSASGSK